jgi:hypothetical protein
MKRGKQNRSKKSSPKHSLSLPDLDQARSAVVNSLPSKESQRGYRHAIDEFITWYCSEPRLSFNKAVVTRYRTHLESRQLARPARSAVDLRPSDASHMKPLIPAYSALTLPRVSDESKGRRTSAFVWGTGSPSTRQERSGRFLTGMLSRANETERSSASSWVAGCAGKGRQSWTLLISSGGRTIGPLLIWSAKAGIFGRSPFRIGSRTPSTCGLCQLA